MPPGATHPNHSQGRRGEQTSDSRRRRCRRHGLWRFQDNEADERLAGRRETGTAIPSSASQECQQPCKSTRRCQGLLSFFLHLFLFCMMAIFFLKKHNLPPSSCVNRYHKNRDPLNMSSHSSHLPSWLLPFYFNGSAGEITTTTTACWPWG